MEYWFAAYVRSCCEKKAAAMLESMGIDHYLAVQHERHKWSDRFRDVDRMVIPRVIFLHTTMEGRLRALKEVPYIQRFIMAEKGAFHPAKIPDEQMEAFRFMVEHGREKIKLASVPIVPGDRCLIISGSLNGLECDVVNLKDKKYAAVRLPCIGTALANVPLDAIKKIVD